MCKLGLFFFWKNQTITNVFDVNSLRRRWAELRQEVNASCGRMRLFDFCHIRYVTSGEPICSLFCVFGWLMNVTCSEKQEKRARVEVVEANACQSAVEVTPCLLLYPPLVSGRCAGSAGLQKAFFPSNLSGTDGDTSVGVCLRLRFPRGTAVAAASG